eukprot:GFYU01023443.1.p1 GENE.GFYU01023443.1~~GFYU01023443.1.p1  ORF type:complete len:172 (-),score=38.64 GFYU01023443.1:90-605(-)
MLKKLRKTAQPLGSVTGAKGSPSALGAEQRAQREQEDNAMVEALRGIRLSVQNTDTLSGVWWYSQQDATYSKPDIDDDFWIREDTSYIDPETERRMEEDEREFIAKAAEKRSKTGRPQTHKTRPPMRAPAASSVSQTPKQPTPPPGAPTRPTSGPTPPSRPKGSSPRGRPG